MPSLLILNVTLIETRLQRARGKGKARQKARQLLPIYYAGAGYQGTFGESMLRYHPCDAGGRVGQEGV